MCGILGKVNYSNERIDQEQLESAAQLIFNRGPDDSGVIMLGECALAHRRLSILDLTSSGHQPMRSLNGRYVCVFNGEIYNYKEISGILEGDGIRWKGHSDTEVLLEAWAQWGVEALDRIDGMYAFAIWDCKEKKLYLARDRMGEKPCYYHWNGVSFGFSSRPSPLFKLFPNLSKQYDEQALRLYLESGYVPAPFSIHKEIRKLPAAHYLCLDSAGMKIHRYWDFRNIVPQCSWSKRSDNDLLDELDGILSNSVKQRMVSDVPLGAFLSGGIDSSLMVAMMMRHASAPIKTFTIGFKEKGYDESADASAVAQYLGSEHRCEMMSVDSLLSLLPSFLSNYDEPFFDSAAFPTMAVSRLARKHVTVSITGDGGDELFGGYHYYRIAQALSYFYKTPKWFRHGASRLAGVIPVHNYQLLSSALRQGSIAKSFAFSRSIAKDFRQVLDQDIIGSTSGLGDLFEQAAEEFPYNLSAGEQGMRLDALYTMNDDYLQKTDVASMAYSLESRSPLLGRDVVEWAMRLPSNKKLSRQSNKYLLRKLAYRYVPKDILDRPKRGFGVPIDGWLRGPLLDWAKQRINDPAYFMDLPIDQSSVKALFKLHNSGMRNAHPLLWAILMVLEFNYRLRYEGQ